MKTMKSHTENSDDSTGKIIELVLDALDSPALDGEELGDAIPALAVIATIMARDVGMPATDFMSRVAQTIDHVYGGDDDEPRH